MEIEGHWRDLQTRGFLVVRNFLPPDLLRAAAEEGAVRATRAEGGVASPTIRAAVAPRIQEALAEIRRHSDLELTHIAPFSRYFTEPTPFWHTDPPPYFMFQNLYQYVNFWMPVVKPDKNDAGLMVVPMDRLAEHDAAVFDAIRGRGNAVFIPKEVAAEGTSSILRYFDALNDADDGSKTASKEPWWTVPLAGQRRLGKIPRSSRELLYEHDGQMKHLPATAVVDEFSVAPSLSPGDVIMARGDVLHHGQGQSNTRIALSVRAVSGSLPLRAQWLRDLSEYARKAIFGGPKPKPYVAGVLGTCALLDRDTVTAAEFIEFQSALENKEERHVRAFESVKSRLPEYLGPGRS